MQYVFAWQAEAPEPLRTVAGLTAKRQQHASSGRVQEEPTSRYPLLFRSGYGFLPDTQQWILTRQARRWVQKEPTSRYPLFGSGYRFLPIPSNFIFYLHPRAGSDA